MVEDKIKMNTNDVAELLGVPISVVYRYVYNGTLKANQVYKGYVYDEESVYALKSMLAINSLFNWCQEHEKFGDLLLSEWIGTDKNGKPLDIEKVLYSSNKNVMWKCKHGHTWYESIGHRTQSRTVCKECEAEKQRKLKEQEGKLTKVQQRKIEKSLAYWCQEHGEFGKLLLSEWGGYDIKGEALDINKIEITDRQSVLWKCKNEHTWYDRVSQRITFRKKCIICNPEPLIDGQSRTGTRGTSYPEQFLYYALKQVYSDTENRCRVHGYEFDIVIPSIPLCIEYSPTYWHKDKLHRDMQKMRICKQYNIRFINIQEDSYNELEHKFDSDYICFHATVWGKKRDEELEQCVETILKSLGHSKDEVDFEKVKSDATAFMSKEPNYYSEHPFENI